MALDIVLISENALEDTWHLYYGFAQISISVVLEAKVSSSSQHVAKGKVRRDYGCWVGFATEGYRKCVGL